MSEPGVITACRYGKDLVRVCRVVRDGEQHYVAEYTVCILLEGDIETSYTEADNTVVVPTDTVKNTVYIFAKTSPHVLDPPTFALHLGLHFVKRYGHIHKAHVDIIALKWSRIEVAGKPHKWAFVRDGEEKGIINCTVDATGGVEHATASLTIGMKDLLVMKTSGSAFEHFHLCENTILPPCPVMLSLILLAVADRIFSTSVTLSYTVPLPPNTPLSIDNLGTIAKELDFAKIATNVRTATLEIFATDESASVQATQYKTLQRFLTDSPAISEAEMSLPNKHYIPVNLSPFELDNHLGYEGGAEVFHPVADPSGLIKCTVKRK